MPPENLNGCVIYNITYHCKICIPIENTLIIAQIKVINQELIIAVNGPIMFFIPKENVDTNIWDIPEGYLNKSKNKKIQRDDYVKIQVIDKRINQNDSQIKSIGKLIDFASSEEVDKYFGSKIVTEQNIEALKLNLMALDSVNLEADVKTESNYII
jgi:DNA-directed RNA polymerase subunit E'/Rpb7